MRSRSENALSPAFACWLRAAFWVAGIALSGALPTAALDPFRAVTQYPLETWGVHDGLPGDPILSISQTSQGYLRLDTADETLRFDGVRFSAGQGPQPSHPGRPPSELLVGLPPELAEAIAALRDRNGNLWLGTRDRGLARIGPDGIQYLGPDQGLPDAAVTAMAEDREGSLWVATGDGSLAQLHDGKFLLISESEGLAVKAVRAVFEDHLGRLWIGTDGGGLHRIEHGALERWSTEDGLASDVVLSLAEDAAGNLWIGTAGGGLQRFDDEPREIYTSADGLPSDIVTALLPDRRGNLWVGTLGGGLGRLRQDGSIAVVDDRAGLSSGIVRTLLEDQRGDLWVGTDDGLNRLRLASGELSSIDVYTPVDGVASTFILSLFQDTEGLLWIGTDSGLSRYDGKVFRTLTTRQGLFNDVLYQLLDDHLGNLWACSNKGIFSLRKAQIEQLVEGRIDHLTPSPLAGSSHHECNGFSQPAGWRGADGSLWFSTVDGLMRVTSGGPPLNPLPAPVVIEEVRVDFQPVDTLGPAELPAGSRDFEFRFTALSLLNPSRVLFSHRLEPFEEEWTDPNDRRSLRYTNLPPGHYRLQVTATNDDGLWNPRPAAFRFEIKPPFYRTAPFYSLCAAAILGLGTAIHQWRFRRLHQRNRRLEEKIARRTTKVLEQKEELGRTNRELAQANRQLRRINEELANLDRENADFLAIAAHDLRTPLVNLKGFAGEIRGALEPLQIATERAAGLLDPRSLERARNAFGVDAPEALGFIDTSTERMDQLIDALLALSQLGRQKLHLEPIDMNRLVQETLRSLTYQISRNRVRVTVGDLPVVFADRASMKQVMENLLNNAVNYLDPQRAGRVTLGAEVQASEVVIHVQDNGRGIAANQAHKVFKIFGRAGAADVPGEGVGLAFVRTLIERHGGRIWFESEEGAGTTFFFSLPRRLEEAGHGS